MQIIEHIISATKSWLKPDNLHLQKAIDRTVDEGLFSLEDILHQIEVFRKNLKAGEIEEWVNTNGLSDDKSAKGKKVLCLHAGNLPLVGFQTVVGTLLSRADYFGKLSRKDPYLLASYLDEVRSKTDQNVEYSIDLNHFENLQADVVIFAGSSESIPTVKNEIKKLNAAKPNAKFIIRTAKFSIAYLEDQRADSIENLIEATLRYGGKGCRSVAVVVSPFSLESVEEELIAQAELFWQKNPPLVKPNSRLKYQFAYNKAIGHSQIWLKDFLIQESDEYPETEFTVNWMIGDEAKVKELKTRYGDSVQSIYTSGNKVKGLETEFLSQAQRPSLWWTPDGLDVIGELVKREPLRGYAKGIDASFNRDEDRF